MSNFVLCEWTVGEVVNDLGREKTAGITNLYHEWTTRDRSRFISMVAVLVSAHMLHYC